MPFIRLKEIRGMDAEKREAKLHELQIELSKLKAMIHAGGALENPSRVKEIRKAIARIMTVHNESVKSARAKGED
jgi:large subunit ribosomal protein L29